jgi:hypothetical protein
MCAKRNVSGAFTRIKPLIFVCGRQIPGFDTFRNRNERMPLCKVPGTDGRFQSELEYATKFSKIPQH